MLPLPVPWQVSRSDSPSKKNHATPLISCINMGGDLYQCWGALYHCYNIPHLALIQHVPPSILGKMSPWPAPVTSHEKSLSRHTALETNLASAIVIYQIRVHLNAKNTHFLTTKFCRMKPRKHNFGAHLEPRLATHTTVQGKIADCTPRQLGAS